jgi:hypothetical protein
MAFDEFILVEVSLGEVGNFQVFVELTEDNFVIAGSELVAGTPAFWN